MNGNFFKATTVQVQSFVNPLDITGHNSGWSPPGWWQGISITTLFWHSWMASSFASSPPAIDLFRKYDISRGVAVVIFPSPPLFALIYSSDDDRPAAVSAVLN